MPVDAAPTDDGNVELLDEADTIRAVVHSQAPLGVDELRLSHFVTCPDAASWRR